MAVLAPHFILNPECHDTRLNYPSPKVAVQASMAVLAPRFILNFECRDTRLNCPSAEGGVQAADGGARPALHSES